MQELTSTLIHEIKTGVKNFGDVLAFIDQQYRYTPAAFSNGEVFNTTEQNQGSARVFAFAKLNNLDEADTMSLFAEHYRAVLDDPEGSNHQNIRQFMIHGWSGIKFDGHALVAK